ncbi:gp37 [Clostera anastomosis granulovirus A]|uniref:Gp37 n=1 Tax=Clostera anastomosis granulovirus A TaxID=1986289 RepID=U5KB31_9BBAC|nr:gp37 [Clostera anastomosis granulovirus Henan]AGQ20271.1 gp37 [Clostera anastomosis granulovirus Henan]
MIVRLMLLASLMVADAFGHGYMVVPLARQRRCYEAQDYYWPFDGSGIENGGCRKAYQHVYRKSGSAAAQAMFDQSTEYAAIAGPNYEDHNHIRNTVVPDTLCGAGARDAWSRFGDKSGVDVVSEQWFPNVLERRPIVDMYFCPTAIHEPSYFEVYVTRDDYRVGVDAVTWEILTLVYRNSSNLVHDEVVQGCDSGAVYRLNGVPLPNRSQAFVVYVRWQREDAIGEGFYNCADVVFAHNEL